MTTFTCPVEPINRPASPTISVQRTLHWVDFETAHRPVTLRPVPSLRRPFRNFAFPAARPISARKSAVTSTHSLATEEAAPVTLATIAKLDIFRTESVAPLPPVETPKPAPKPAAVLPAPKQEDANEDYDKIVERILAAHKSDCLKLKMSINRHVGQVCDSWSQVQRIARELISLAKQVSADLRMYALVTTVDKVLNQAEAQCALHTPSAFPLAALIINVSNNVPEFHKVFKQRLQERCPPLFSQEFKKGEVFDIEKKCGLVCLYAAVLSFSQPQDKGAKSQVFDIRDGWKFVAATLNKAPSVYTSAILCFFLELSGYGLWLTFGGHFAKLMLTIKNGYMAKLPAQSKSYNESLKIVVETFCSAGKPEKPKGMDINE